MREGIGARMHCCMTLFPPGYSRFDAVRVFSLRLSGNFPTILRNTELLKTHVNNLDNILVEQTSLPDDTKFSGKARSQIYLVF